MRQTVVYLKQNQLEVFRVEGGEKTVKAETEWSTDNLVEKLKLVKDKFETSSVRVLVAREIAGTELVLDNLAEAATQAKLTVEAVEPESLMEGEGDQVVILAEKELENAVGNEVKMTTEVVVEDGRTQEQTNVQTHEQNNAGMYGQNNARSEEMVKPLVSVGRKVGKRDMRFVWIGLGVVLLIGLVVGGVWRARSSRPTNGEPDMVITPQATPTPTPTPTPEAVDLSELSGQILNGSGVVGEAGRVIAVLAKGGMDEDKLSAANAKSYDYEETEVRVKKGLAAGIYDEIASILGDDYTVEEGAQLPASSEYDIQIIVGTREGAVQGATATATPKPAATATPAPTASASASATPTATGSADTNE